MLGHNCCLICNTVITCFMWRPHLTGVCLSELTDHCVAYPGILCRQKLQDLQPCCFLYEAVVAVEVYTGGVCHEEANNSVRHLALLLAN